MRVAIVLLGSLALIPLAGTAQSSKGGNAAVEKKLESLEKSGWEAWKNHDPKPFDKMLPEDSVNVVSYGVDEGKAAIMKDVGGTSCDVKSYSLSDFKYQWLNPTTVVMRYTATSDATCSGKKYPAKVWASSVWQNKGGNWVSPFHQETTPE